jgi:Zn-dependent peptidase ImmA (M78 family)
MRPTPTHMNQHAGVLASLRAVAPARPATFSEALRVAELQAHRLLELWDITDGFVPSEIITELPRVTVIYADLPVSGTSHWNGTAWIISLNRADSWTRRRFTLMHEFKHIVDHGQTADLYTGDRRRTPAEQAELTADYFAGCLLMPKRLLKHAWGSGIQRPAAVGHHFRVSARAAQVRLAQTGLSDSTDRCGRHWQSPAVRDRSFEWPAVSSGPERNAS